MCQNNLILGLECWSCNSDGFDPDMHDECIDTPEIGRHVTCSSNQTHCYVYRILSPGPRNSKNLVNQCNWFVITSSTGLTFSRGCCEVKDGSPTCPENGGEDDYEFNDGINHGRYFRCDDQDLCNNGTFEFELPGTKMFFMN